MPWPSSTAGFSKPKSKRQKPASTKWVDLQPRERKAPGLQKVGKKGEWWSFIALIVDRFHERIGLLDTCEIVEAGCDNYHRAWAHTRRRQDIRVEDWRYGLRVIRACQECHYWADALQEGRTNSEVLIDAIRVARNTRLGLTEADVERILLECAIEIQKENPGKDGAPGKYDRYEVVFP